ncbi:stage III sporulation protein AG [Anoxybacillus gonensis]|uniref:Stage III sporulation protein AG n=1 Tax=Anoxybacillus gonensis TaxID=198467 RepID=A0AAW7TDF8_9BACL|nr:stage III sporulation protein AG [Anoxybacillus gonensis]AKS38867.1 stage III sporulation protein AG [Anoxybacillus gonensis]KGP60028.1 stage III sporulation protein AG [Anoxybacillus gonensis]MCQ5364129.1 stage III sporulation protein AG [Anoxybacillus gonensis]MCX8047169.1 stage III sporulation protein AG [Anoxybacillus gonensis]MDO0876195.1 stage III sporulation protein AG [Anoxybacillus gonensis]
MKQWIEKNGFIAILLVIGLSFMIFGNVFNFSASKRVQQETTQTVFRQTDEEKKLKQIADYEERYEQQLKEALEAIVGVGEVKVIVNVDATEQNVLEKNAIVQKKRTMEEDKEGGKRQIEDESTDEKIVIVRKGDEETPLVLQTKKPDIRGVLVVAKGADQVQVKKWIVEAVTRTLNVPSHRVAVLPKK